MSDRAMARLSLLISLVAVGYAVWLHSRANDLAMEALRRREQSSVKSMAPKFKLIWADMGDTRAYKSEPQTIEDLMSPLVGIMDSLAATQSDPQNGADSPTK